VKKSPVIPFLMGVTTAGATMAAVYALVVRPWHLKWGASPNEVGRSMPGDEVILAPKIETTRAITIAAPPSSVYPWLLQIGFRRAGWYSYDALEKMAGVGDFEGGSSSKRIVPELQALKVGDIIRTDPDGGFTVTALKPNRLFSLRAKIHGLTGKHMDLEAPLEDWVLDTSWVFQLEEIEHQGGTRLTVRFRADYVPSWQSGLFARVLFEPVLFLMERKMLLGIKMRAEGQAS
jgi:hypothetical protein